MSAPGYTIVTLEDGEDLAEGVRYEIQGPKGVVGWTIERDEAFRFVAGPALENVAHALLLFYSVGPWDEDKARQWKLLTGRTEATSKALGDFARAALATARGGT